MPALERGAVGIGEQIQVALAERVAHFAQHGAHGAGAIVADPEADRVEHVAQHSRKGVQHDFPVGIDALGGQERAHPGFEWSAVAGTVVAIVERHDAAAVASDATRF